MPKYRLAGALEVLRSEVNERWPHRSKVSDGWIGDTAHASTGSASDHNPWIIDRKGVPVVRAFDITGDGIDADWLADHLRQLGAAGDPRLTDHGYVIWAGRIASEKQGWWWRTYTGADPHTSHIHVSVARDQAGYDSTVSWLADTAHPQEDDMAQVPQNEWEQVNMIVHALQADMDDLKARTPSREQLDAIIGPEDGMQVTLARLEKSLAKIAAKVGA